MDMGGGVCVFHGVFSAGGEGGGDGGTSSNVSSSGLFSTIFSIGSTLSMFLKNM